MRVQVTVILVDKKIERAIFKLIECAKALLEKE